MKRIAAFVLAVLDLAGCVPQRMDDGLQSLIGQNIQAAVGKLGYPDGQRTMLGDTIYIWNTGHQGALPIAGTVVPFSFNCTIQIATTPDGTIKQPQWAGNVDGCRGYATVLAR